MGIARLNKAMTLKSRVVISSATMTARCSRVGQRRRSMSQYSIERMMRVSSTRPSMTSTSYIVFVSGSDMRKSIRPPRLFPLPLDDRHIAQAEEGRVFQYPLLKPPFIEASVTQRRRLRLVVVQGHVASISNERRLSFTRASSRGERSPLLPPILLLRRFLGLPLHVARI